MQSRKLTILLILLIALTYTLWITPQKEKLESHKANLSSVQAELASITLDKINVSNNLDISDLDSKLVNQAIPEKFDQDEIIKILKNIAEEYNVVLISLGFNQSFAEQTNQIKASQISLNVNGSPEGIKGFLSAIENTNRGFFVKNINLTYQMINDVEVASLTLTIETYFS